MLLKKFNPSILIVPLSESVSLSRILPRVDFPDPLSPTNETISPYPISKFIFSRALTKIFLFEKKVFFVKAFDKFSIEIRFEFGIKICDEESDLSRGTEARSSFV